MAFDHTPETRPSLHTLEQRGDFIRRHIGPDPRQIGDMLGTLGLATLEALIDRAVPAAIRISEPLAHGRDPERQLHRRAPRASPPYYPVLYTGKNGRVAHECILDLNWLLIFDNANNAEELHESLPPVLPTQKVADKRLMRGEASPTRCL